MGTVLLFAWMAPFFISRAIEISYLTVFAQEMQTIGEERYNPILEIKIPSDGMVFDLAQAITNNNRSHAFRTDPSDLLLFRITDQQPLVHYRPLTDSPGVYHESSVRYCVRGSFTCRKRMNLISDGL